MASKSSKAVTRSGKKIAAGNQHPRMPESTRIKVIRFRDRGFSIAQIANKLNISTHGVRYTLQRFEKHGSVQNLKRPGRPNKIPSLAVSQLKARLVKGTFETTKACVEFLSRVY